MATAAGDQADYDCVEEIEMKTVTVSGSSDDIISIEGDIQDELSPDDDKPIKLAFSEGTVLSVAYDGDGCWRVNRVAAGTAKMEKVEATGADSTNYSDRITLTGDIRWCVAGNHMAKVEIP